MLAKNDTYLMAKYISLNLVKFCSMKIPSKYTNYKQSVLVRKDI